MNNGSLIKLGKLFGWRSVVIVLSMASSIIWARFVSKETYGAYQMILAAVTLAMGFCLSGLGESATIAAAKGFDGNIRRIFGWRGLVSLAGSVGLLIAGGFYARTHAGIFGAFAIAALMFPFIQMRAVWSGWLNGRGLVEKLFILDVVMLVFWLMFFGVLVWTGNAHLKALILVKFGVEACFAAGVVLFILRQRKNATVDDKSFYYGIHVSAAQLLGGLIVVDRLLLGSLSLSDLAVYSVALIFPEQIKMIYAVINQVLVPEMYKASGVRAGWEYLKPKMLRICCFFWGIGLAGFLLFPVVIPLLFSQKYVEAVPYAKWLWLSLAFTAPATYLSNLLVAQQKKRYVYVMNAGMPVFMLACFIGCMGWGIWGFVGVKIASNILIALVYSGALVFFLSKESFEARAVRS